MSTDAYPGWQCEETAVGLRLERDGVVLWRGDCLEVLPTLGVVDAVVTDPPYGIDCTKVGSGTGGKGTFHRFTLPGASRIAGDADFDPSFLSLLPTVATVLYSFSRWDVDDQWKSAIQSSGWKVKNRIIWAKAHFGSGDLERSFGNQHETLWRAIREGAKPIRVTRCGDVWRDAWTECIRHGKSHPFEKPVDLLEKAILADSDQGDTILDPYMGSGSTGCASVKNYRRFIGIELDHVHFDTAVQRITAALLAEKSSLFPAKTLATQPELF